MNNHRGDNGVRVYHSCIIFLFFLLVISIIPSVTAADAMFRADPQRTGVYENGGNKPNNTQLWRFRTGDVLGSSPTVSNGSIYVGSIDQNLYAIDAVTGTEKWRFATEGSVESSPAVSNGVVYVGSSDHNLYGIDAATGKEKWRFTTGWWVSSSPVVSNGSIYVGSDDKNLYAIDAVTATEKWEFRTRGYVRSSPAVSNGVVYVGSDDKNLYAIDAVTGTEKWRFTTDGSIESSPVVSNGIVYVGSFDNSLYALDAATGKEKWRFTTGGSLESSPAVSNGIIYVGSFDYNLYALDAVTGTEKWRFKTGNSVRSSLAVSNGSIYVVSTDNNLYAIGGASPSNSGNFYVTMLITEILVLLFIAIGGYAIYRKKKTPSGDQSPYSNKIQIIAPIPQKKSLNETFRPPNNRDLIFISSKSEDFDQTQKVYTFLKDLGYNVFFSQLSLPDMGSSDYRKGIDNALDASKHMIVVTSKKENVEAPWVEAEWGLFINEKRSGRKLGNIITLIIGKMKIEDLPSSLRYYEVIPFDPKNFEKILKYLK